MRVLFVQHGDYREAVYAFREGRPETYHDQRFTVEFVGALCRRNEYVGVISVAADPYDEALPNGVHGFGMRLAHDRTEAELCATVERIRPTHLVLRSPIQPLAALALENRIATLLLLADSFESGGLRGLWNNVRLKRLLNQPHFQWIGNHNVNAARSLARLGVASNKIIPFEYESRRSVRPDALPPKRLDPAAGTRRLIFVGTLSEAKGTGDCLRALKLLRDRGHDAVLTVVGSGEDQRFQSEAQRLGIASSVQFSGRVAHQRIIPLMREHDVVIVPSRHEYAEALPGTIVEAFCSRTPLVVSDHPMFTGRVVEGESGLVFPAGRCEALADRVQHLLTDEALYSRLSDSGQKAWTRLQCPIGWGELITRFLRDSDEDRRRLKAHTLAAFKYP